MFVCKNVPKRPPLFVFVQKPFNFFKINPLFFNHYVFKALFSFVATLILKVSAVNAGKPVTNHVQTLTKTRNFYHVIFSCPYVFMAVKQCDAT